MSRREWWKKRISRLVLPGDFGNAATLRELAAGPGSTTIPAVHMLWVEGDLRPLETLSCASFLASGYRVRLWSYGRPREMPPGATLCDAREIVPEERIFRDPRGSLAAFSDLFRYTVLSRFGGLWADMDVICLRPAADIAWNPSDGFLVTEMTTDARRRQVNNNLIHHPAPRPGDIIDIARAVSERFDPGALRWGDCGPRLLTTLARTYPALRPMVMAPSFANPVPARRCPEALLTPGVTLPAESAFLHCYNERWRQRGLDPAAPWPDDSILARLRQRYR